MTPGFSSGVWYEWVFLMSPVNGMTLGWILWSVPAPLITPLKVGTSLFISILLVPSILKITEASFNA